MAIRKKRHDSRFDRQRKIEHTDFYPYLQRYQEARAIQNYSAHTITNHGNAIRRFVGWCDERGLDEPNTITKPILERYQKHLYYYRKRDGEPLSPRSQHRELSALKGFFKWLTRENYLLYNPASELHLPKQPRRLPHYVLSKEEIKSILNLPDISTPDGLRNLSLIHI